MPPRRPFPREGGAAAVIVLSLLTMLAGIALILLATARRDGFGATNEREQAVAFHAAEAGIAHGKAYLSSVPFDPVIRYGVVLGQTIAKPLDVVVPDTAPPVVIPASFTVTFRNNNDNAPDASGDVDGYVVVRSVGVGPNGARAVIEVTTGPPQPARPGRGPCAEASPAPSCGGR